MYIYTSIRYKWLRSTVNCIFDMPYYVFSAGILYYGQETLYVHWIICYLTGTATLEQSGDGFSALSLTLARAT